MKLSSLFAALCAGSAVASELSLTSRGPKCPQTEGNKDDQIIAHFKQTGNCFSYINGGSREKSFAPCSGPDGYCQKVKKSKSGVEGCKLFTPEGAEPDPSLIGVDEDCNEWLPGECMCECEFCDKIADIVIEGLAKLDDVICAVMLSSFKSILDVGLLFVPGGQASSAVKAAVQGAKSFYQNGEEAASFFGNWIGPACGVPDFDFDISMVFGDLVDAPDSMSRGPPVGCKKKKKSECRKVDPKPDPTKKPDDEANKPTKTKDKPKTTVKTKTKITDDPKTTDDKKTREPATKVSTTTTDPTSTEGAGCAYCGEFEKNGKGRRRDTYDLLYPRARDSSKSPSCVLPPAEDKPSKRSISGFFEDALFSRSFPLLGRSLTEKNAKFKTTFGKANSHEWTLTVGKYAPSSDAANIAEITKYWRFKKPRNKMTCSIEVEQVTNAGAVSISDYETDHVFEAQTLFHFFKWLADDSTAKIGTTYDKPSAEWVEDVLLGDDGFRIISNGKTNPGDLFTSPTGDTVWDVMAYGFGRSDGVPDKEGNAQVERIPATRGNKNLVLLHKNINGPKGIWFQLNKVGIDYKTHTSQLDTRLEVRRGVGPFQYLHANDGAADTMWKKWARVSNWIDLVCHEFDEQYKKRRGWGKHKGEPKNSAGTPSLRSLWAYFIDKELEDIEANAKTWAKDSKKAFDEKWDPKTLTNAEKKWREDAFGQNGFATADKLKFPRPAGLPSGASKYGAYGWADVTFDAGNQDPGIGTPTPIV